MTAGREGGESLSRNVGQLGQYLAQLGQLIGAMQRRMDELEARQAQVTISHAEARHLLALIRARADAICGKNEIADAESRKIFRAAIKKDVLKRHGIRDLHDLPANRLEGAERQIDSWTSIKLILERSGRS